MMDYLEEYILHINLGFKFLFVRNNIKIIFWGTLVLFFSALQGGPEKKEQNQIALYLMNIIN